MTCIVATVDMNGKIWMGGDSCYSHGPTKDLDGEPKIRKRIGKDGTAWLIGCAGQTRFCQIVLEVVDLPEAAIGKQNLSDYIIREWIPILRRTVDEQGGTLQKEGEQRAAGHILLGLKGEMFWIDPSFCIVHFARSYSAIGTGSDFAEGVLWLLANQKSKLAPRKQIRLAIEGSSFHYSDVGGRIDFVST